MRELILARHGESTASVAGVMYGDPAADVPLTELGREQARRLGELLRHAGVGACAVTEHRRTQETLAVARGEWSGPAVPPLVLPALNDVTFGAWEGRPLDEYRTWALHAGPAEPCPGGGESRAEIARRLAAGFAELAARPEELVLAVGHSLPLRYLLDGAAGLVPAARVESVPYAEPFRLAAAQVEAAVALLARWAERPVWRD